MAELPGCLRIIKRGRITRELELLHHLLRAAFFALEQQRQENLEFDELGRLILVAPGGGVKEGFQPIARLRVFLCTALRGILDRPATLS